MMICVWLLLFLVALSIGGENLESLFGGDVEWEVGSLEVSLPGEQNLGKPPSHIEISGKLWKTKFKFKCFLSQNRNLMLENADAYVNGKLQIPNPRCHYFGYASFKKDDTTNNEDFSLFQSICTMNYCDRKFSRAFIYLPNPRFMEAAIEIYAKTEQPEESTKLNFKVYSGLLASNISVKDIYAENTLDMAVNNLFKDNLRNVITWFQTVNDDKKMTSQEYFHVNVVVIATAELAEMADDHDELVSVMMTVMNQLSVILDQIHVILSVRRVIVWDHYPTEPMTIEEFIDQIKSGPVRSIPPGSYNLVLVYHHLPRFHSHDPTWMGSGNLNSEQMPLFQPIAVDGIHNILDIVWNTVHRIGHLLSASELTQTTSCSCYSHINTCVMSQNLHKKVFVWSECSLTAISTHFNKEINKGASKFKRQDGWASEQNYEWKPFCGNGIVETGEQCDCGFGSTARDYKHLFCIDANMCDTVNCKWFPTTATKILATTEPLIVRSTHRHGFTKDHHGHDHGETTNGSELLLTGNYIGNNEMSSPLNKTTSGKSVRAGSFNNDGEEQIVGQEISSDVMQLKNTTQALAGKKKVRKRKTQMLSASSEKQNPLCELLGLFLVILLLFPI